MLIDRGYGQQENRTKFNTVDEIWMTHEHATIGRGDAVNELGLSSSLRCEQVPETVARANAKDENIVWAVVLVQRVLGRIKRASTRKLLPVSVDRWCTTSSESLTLVTPGLRGVVQKRANRRRGGKTIGHDEEIQPHHAFDHTKASARVGSRADRSHEGFLHRSTNDKGQEAAAKSKSDERERRSPSSVGDASAAFALSFVKNCIQ